MCLWWLCFGYVWLRFGCVLVVFWLCFGDSVCGLLVKKTCGKCVYDGYVLAMVWLCFGCVMVTVSIRC